MIMAQCLLLTVLTLDVTLQFVQGNPQRQSRQLVTCPGFPGYCSESYVGDTCTVVCARGRNNVPQCQEDGTWTDVPRCIEHEPGIEEQVTGVCPGIPGYCSLDLPGAVCEFACPVGAAIRSECTEDGTWEPYPTCDGDPRETQDGCNPCPGPNGAPRSRGGNSTISAGARNTGGNRGGGNRGSGGNRRGNNGGGQRNNGGGNRASGGAKRGNGGGNKFGGGQNRQSGGGGGPGVTRRNQNNNSINTPQKAEARKEFQTPRALSGNNSNNRVNNNSNSKGGDSSGQCPGDELEACIAVCPGFSARVFGACVAGCAKRCPAKK